MGTTTDPEHPELTRGTDDEPVGQAPVYLVLSEEEVAKGFVKPFRKSYRHKRCGAVTTMGDKIAATYAADPWFYGGTYCTFCQMHKTLDEFTWEPDGEPMSPHLWPAEEHVRIAELRKKQK